MLYTVSGGSESHRLQPLTEVRIAAQAVPLRCHGEMHERRVAACSFCFSQPCRFLHDFLNMGFNEDERGERVFDAMLNWLGGGSGGFFNYRFAQPGRTHRQHIGRWYPERQFPFANQVLFDPITGKTDGRLARCRASDTCPKIFEANSANEYWVKAGSLLHTDTRGNDLRDPRNVRFSLFSSLPHSAGIGPTGPGICQQPRNPVVANPGLRALLVALDEWVSEGKKPPASRVPLRANGTSSPRYPREMRTRLAVIIILITIVTITMVWASPISPASPTTGS